MVYVERAIRVIAGTMITGSVLLGYFVNKWIIFIAVFVGANLFQFGFTKACPMEVILLKVGITPTPCGSCAATAQAIKKKADEEQDSKLWQLLASLDMTRLIRIIAGVIIMTTALLGLFVSQWVLIGTLFVGVNLFQFGFTNLCPMATFLRMAGIKDNENAPTGKDTNGVALDGTPNVEMKTESGHQAVATEDNAV
jgi:hypothetical protein